MDVTTSSFEQEVLQASATVPVLVDFWAPWCAPCRALSPILEKLEREYAGRFKLTQINSDENQDLAAAFGVRSIPDVLAFRDGKPVAHFLGALPESQVRAFIERLLPSASELERAKGGEAALRKALELDPRNDLARLDLAALLIAGQRGAEAEALLAEVQPNASLDARREALLAAAGFARLGGGASESELKAKLAAAPEDAEAHFTLAQLHASARRYREAMEELLAIVRKDKEWRDGEARKQLLNIFTLAADQPELVSEYRRKLATALY
ncbi:MAG: thioredoxin [Betaproteobacteria bacterium RIFCSPLOWO2_12_FULL_65_14]|nr:MAG: thioredoxin [Betaproteobacteria bacterium RIFCSPLOWO2_12_FULL_65_14]